MRWTEQRQLNSKLYEQAARLVRRLRNSPKLWDDDTCKIDRVLERAIARKARRYRLSGEHQSTPRDMMLNLYA